MCISSIRFAPASNNDVVKWFSAAMFRYCIIINLEKTKVVRLHRTPEGRAGHRAGREETDSGSQFRESRRGSVWRREHRRRERYVEEYRPERTRGEQLREMMADRRISTKTKEQGREHLPIRNGNLGTDQTTTTKAASVRKQLGTKNSKSNEGRQEKNGGVNGRDRSTEELHRETGEEPVTVGRTRRKDGGSHTTEESGSVTRAGQEEKREADDEMGGL